MNRIILPTQPQPLPSRLRSFFQRDPLATLIIVTGGAVFILGGFLCVFLAVQP